MRALVAGDVDVLLAGFGGKGPCHFRSWNILVWVWGLLYVSWGQSTGLLWCMEAGVIVVLRSFLGASLYQSGHSMVAATTVGWDGFSMLGIAFYLGGLYGSQCSCCMLQCISSWQLSARLQGVRVLFEVYQVHLGVHLDHG